LANQHNEDEDFDDQNRRHSSQGSINESREDYLQDEIFEELKEPEI
jgi:hypothetical protein